MDISILIQIVTGFGHDFASVYQEDIILIFPTPFLYLYNYWFKQIAHDLAPL